jgi:hypothetical protein
VSDVLLGRLRRVVQADGGVLADALAPPVRPRERAYGEQADLGALAAAGPRAGGRRDDLALAVEAVREGYLLHYGTARLFAAADGDLALLAGDRLYALGLALLARLGDLAAVAELADVIALSAQAHAAGQEDLAEAVWEAGAVAVGWGATEAIEAAKDAARRGVPTAAEALRVAARQARADLARDPRAAGASEGRSP